MPGAALSEQAHLVLVSPGQLPDPVVALVGPTFAGTRSQGTRLQDQTMNNNEQIEE